MAQQPLRGNRYSELYSIAETLKVLVAKEYDNIRELKKDISSVIKHIEADNKPAKLKK